MCFLRSLKRVQHPDLIKFDLVCKTFKPYCMLAGPGDDAKAEGSVCQARATSEGAVWRSVDVMDM